MRTKAVATRAGLYALVGVSLGFLLFPIYWMFITSLKQPGEVYRLPQTYWPRRPTIQAYARLFQVHRFGGATLNTLLVASLSALGGTLLGAAAGFGFNRFHFPGRALLWAFMIVGMALPGMVTVGPVFMAYKDTGLLDTKTGLTLIDVAGGIPFALYYLYAFFQRIPRELDEAALIDGCSWPGVIWRITLPVSASGVAVTFIVLFINVWNEFLFANVLTIGERSRMLSVRILEIGGGNLGAAAGMLCLLPPILIVLAGQRQIAEAAVAGSLKGA